MISNGFGQCVKGQSGKRGAPAPSVAQQPNTGDTRLWLSDWLNRSGFVGDHQFK